MMHDQSELIVSKHISEIIINAKSYDSVDDDSSGRNCIV